LSAKATVQNEGYDLVVIDTSPGIQYSSFNALAASNLVVLVMNRDELYRDDVTDLVNKVYKPLGRGIGIALNKVLFCASGESLEKSQETSRKSFQLKKNVEEKFGCRVLALIPCFCDVLVGGYEVYALNKPEHPFTAEMFALSNGIWNNLQ
jgi:septum site-determining protein MinD